MFYGFGIGFDMAAGRPLLFGSVEELSRSIEEYCASCQMRKEKDPDTGEEIIIDGQQPTITGLAYFLGFESRQSFYDYEEREEFSYTIKRARLHIESNYEQALFSKNPTGPIFALKNFGWRDRQEISSTSTIKDERLDLSKLSEDELRVLAEIQRKSGASKTET